MNGVVRLTNRRAAANILRGARDDHAGHQHRETEVLARSRNTGDDVAIHDDIIDSVRNYLIEGNTYTLLFADGLVADIELPPSMEMIVAESPEGVKGDSANNAYKSATMETGLVVQVPLFINPGEKLIIKTEDGSYISRA